MDLNTNLEDYPKRFKMVYEKNLVNLRKIFCIWIGKISRKNFNNIDWWVLNHVSRDSTKSKLYHSFCLLERSPMQSGTSLI